MDSDSLPPGFSGAGLPRSFRRRVVTIGPRRCRGFDASEWADAIVLVERGRVEVACADGTVLRFGERDLLWLAGLPVRSLRNPGEDETVLVAVRRRRRGPPGLRGLLAGLGARLTRRFR